MQAQNVVYPRHAWLLLLAIVRWATSRTATLTKVAFAHVPRIHTATSGCSNAQHTSMTSSATVSVWVCACFATIDTNKLVLLCHKHMVTWLLVGHTVDAHACASCRRTGS